MPSLCSVWSDISISTRLIGHVQPSVKELFRFANATLECLVLCLWVEIFVDVLCYGGSVPSHVFFIFFYYDYYLHSGRDGKQKAPCCYSNHLLRGSVEHGVSNLRRASLCAGGAFMKHTSVVVLHCVHPWPWKSRRFRKGARLNAYS